MKLLSFAGPEAAFVAPLHQKVEPLLLVRGKLPQSFLWMGKGDEFPERNATLLANRCRQLQIEPFDLGMLIAEAVEALDVDFDSTPADTPLQLGHIHPALAKNCLQSGMCNSHKLTFFR